MKVDQRVIIRAGEGRVGKDHICVISTAGKGDDHSDDDSCGQRPDLCDHHSRGGDDHSGGRGDLRDHHSGERR